MAKIPFTIDSIWGGMGQSDNFFDKGQYLASVGIDPDMPKNDNSKKPCGFIRPTAMEKFSGTDLTGIPLWIVTSPKGEVAYVYTSNGRVHVVTSSEAMGTALNSGNALSSSSGNGAEYYDNKILFAKNTDIASYGPLDGSPALDEDYWTSALGKTALSNKTYPSINGVQMPNHAMLRSVDSAQLFICDVVDNKGALHVIETLKTTVEGDTDDGSAYNVVQFEYGYWPTCLAQRNNEIIVGLIEGSSTAVRQKPFALSIWSPTETAFTTLAQHEFPDPIVSAIVNANGNIYVFSGFASGGCRISLLLSNYTLQEVAFYEDIYPPLAGAAEHILSRVLFGSAITLGGVNYGVAFALGSKKRLFSGQGIHGVLKSTAGSTSPMVTCLKYFKQDANFLLRPIIGWKNNTDYGLDKLSTTYGTSIFYSKKFILGGPFSIEPFFVPLQQAIGANMSIEIIAHYDDDESLNTSLITINNTTHPGVKNIRVDSAEKMHGMQSVFFEFKITGTALSVIGLPVSGVFNMKNKETE